MNRCRIWLVLSLLVGLGLLGLPATAQDNEPVSMTVEAGFNNFYRAGYWLPLQIQVSNEGAGFSGRLTVRPETSGRAVSSAFSTPIDLPAGSDKTAFLYIQAQPGASAVIIELIDDEGVRIAEQAAGLTSIFPDDSLHMAVSNTGASSIPLNRAVQPGQNSRQGRWDVTNLPPDTVVLNAIDTLLFYDVDSDALTVDQKEAIEAWVTMGGHLIIIGGPSWVQTTTGFDEGLLPFSPDGSENVEDVSGLAAYVNLDDTLEDLTFITTGDVADNARVLAETDEGLPLLIRQDFGLGVVDFLTVDPTLEPVRSWEALDEFWFLLVSDLPPEPGWQRGLLDLQDAARSIAILPNVELLPPATSMILFIAAYILLIGPVNYFVLSRMRRRAWAWVTIPVMIVAFTMLAWNVGFNLRGNELIVSRLYVVHSFPESDLAYQDQLTGVLSPKRDIYTINAPGDTVMGLLPGVEDDSLFSANVTRTTADISQGQVFTVEDVAIDGGIFANFHMASVVEAPAISGSAALGYRPEDREEDANMNVPTPQSIRGVVRNDSDITLEDVVIIARNQFYRVDSPLEPGDVLDFDTADFELINNNLQNILPVAAPIESHATNLISEELVSTNRRSTNDTLVTSRVLLNLDWSSGLNRIRDDFEIDLNDEELSRRRALTRSFMRDQNTGLGVGNQVYVMGWTTEAQPQDLTIVDTEYRTVDTTLHIIELDIEIEEPPSTETITLSPDQFTWSITGVEPGQVFGNLASLTIISPGWAEIQVVPQEGAILETVDTIMIEVNRGTSLGREIEIGIWNYDTQTWDFQDSMRVEDYVIENPAPYLGRDNMVKVRFQIDSQLQSSNNNGRVLQTRVIQIGNF